jgi:hypothetical protein
MPPPQNESRKKHKGRDFPSAMKPENLARLVRVYERWAESLCAPIVFPDEAGQMHNGSMTFLRTNGQVLGITNAHVADAIKHCDDELDKRCQVGGAYLDPGRLNARHPTLDLATFQLSDVFLNAAEGNRPLGAATVTIWPPKRPSEGDSVLFGGYLDLLTLSLSVECYIVNCRVAARELIIE